MLEAMRRNTKVVLWITVIFFVLLIFLVWGADLQFGNDGPQTNSAGTVNGDEISYAAYQQVLSYNRESARTGGRELRPSEELLLEEQSFQSLVDEALLRQEAARRGYAPTDAEVRAVLIYDPPAVVTQNPDFQNAQGVFDLAAYQAILRNPNTPDSFLLQLEAYIRNVIPTQRLQDIVTSSVKVTEEEMRRAWLDQNETATVKYVVTDFSSAPNPGTPSDADLKSYFEANQSKYALPARATLRYVTVPRVATGADSLELQAELRELAAEARRAATDKERRASDFETLVMTFSDGPNAETGGLTPAPVLPSELSPTFQAALRGLQPGQISEPFHEGMFYHMIQLVELNEAGNDSIAAGSVRIRDLALRIDPSDSTLTATQEALETLRQEAMASNLTKAAEVAGYEVQTAENVTSAGIAPGLTAIPQVAAFALDNPKGTISRVLATNNAWFLLEVAEQTPAGTPDFDAVVDRVRTDWLTDQRANAVKARAEALLRRTAAGDSLDVAASAESLTVVTSPIVTRSGGIPGLGREPELLAAVFASPTGSVAGPVRTPRGWVVLQVVSRPAVDWTLYESQKGQISRALVGARQGQVFNAWLESLRKKASIKDLRS